MSLKKPILAALLVTSRLDFDLDFRCQTFNRREESPNQGQWL